MKNYIIVTSFTTHINTLFYLVNIFLVAIVKHEPDIGLTDHSELQHLLIIIETCRVKKRISGHLRSVSKCSVLYSCWTQKHALFGWLLSYSLLPSLGNCCLARPILCIVSSVSGVRLNALIFYSLPPFPLPCLPVINTWASAVFLAS